MVPNDDRFIRVCAIDDTDHIPYWRDLLLHDVRKRECSSRRRTCTIANIQSSNPTTPLNLLSRNTVVIKRPQQWKSVPV